VVEGCEIVTIKLKTAVFCPVVSEFIVKVYLSVLFLYTLFVENKPGETRIPEIFETEKEKRFSTGQLKYCYLQIARQRFQGKVFINKDTQNPIRVSRDGINEWWRKSRRREHIISVQSLDFFLENGVFIDESPDYKNRPEIEGASQFESVCRVNGKLFKVIITIRKGVDDIAKFRYYTLRNIQLFPA